jgi:hypothetical protein
MTAWKPASALGELVHAAGFAYDPDQDILYSRKDALQRNVGYGYLYDDAALAADMVIDCEPIFFQARGKDWMVELWKGQYILETGCEVGVYTRSRPPPAYYAILDKVVGTRPHDPANGHYFQCADDADMLTIGFTLYRDGKPVFSRGPEKHWWLTGFKWGVYSTPEQLKMEVAFNLPADVHGPFVAALRKRGYVFTDDGANVRFTFDKPFSHQPRTGHPQLAKAQQAQKAVVATYAGYKLPNNDPNKVPPEKAQGLGAAVAAKSVDLLGAVLAEGLRKAGKSAAEVARLIAHDLRIAADRIEHWVTRAGYDIVQWVQSVFTAIGKALTMDFSTAVEVHNLTHNGVLPVHLTLVASGAKQGRWVVPPPGVIPAGRVGRFYLKDNLGALGSIGHATYAYVDVHGRSQRVTFDFGCPTGLDDNFARSSQGIFNVFGKSGAGTPRWGAAGRIPPKKHPLYVAYVWANGPAPG